MRINFEIGKEYKFYLKEDTLREIFYAEFLRGNNPEMVQKSTGEIYSIFELVHITDDEKVVYL